MDVERQPVGLGRPEGAAAEAAAASRCWSSRTSPSTSAARRRSTQVGMHVSAGEIVALLGENGAGKSTLIKILAGVYTLDAGHRDATAAATRPHSLRRLPIAFIHQDLGLIDWMTVAENICLTLGYPAPRSA